VGVYKRNGKWEVRLQIRGRKYYRHVPEAANKAQALVAEATLRKEVYEGRYGRDGQEFGATDFVRFVREVFLPSARDRLRDAHHVEYVSEVLCRHFRGRRLKDITAMLIEGYKRARLAGNSRLGRPRHPATVKGEIGVLSRVFNMALDNDLIGLNPCRKVRWGQGQTDCRRERVLSRAEEARLMPQLERYPEVRDATVIALNTGLRRMAILGLRDADLDPERRALRYTAKGGRVKYLPLNPAAFAVVSRLAADPAPGGHLFRLRTGLNISGRRGAFHLACARAGVRDFRFHDLRHTFSSRVREHTDAFTLRDLLGHADVKTTGLYTNPQFEEMRRAVEALSERPAGQVLEMRTAVKA
jgi:integrase